MMERQESGEHDQKNQNMQKEKKRATLLRGQKGTFPLWKAGRFVNP